MQTSVKGVVLPPHWEHIERTDKLKMIQLDGQGAGSLLEREYQEVQTKFMKTMATGAGQRHPEGAEQVPVGALLFVRRSSMILLIYFVT
ncbi:hypothetical protein DPMN_125829 [Dreissena polymorpha]|uniref:Uncharacterized protein n=1 Tax=Dreissena polymorpha TaxID=45954 RepID=A0A9D4JTX0_DREPO|nr:hypothetical protein DPMN_125829 [Dreissena polymorpha]